MAEIRWKIQPLQEPGVLSELCDEFRRGVFEKAGKQDPSIGSVG